MDRDGNKSAITFTVKTTALEKRVNTAGGCIHSLDNEFHAVSKTDKSKKSKFATGGRKHTTEISIQKTGGYHLQRMGNGSHLLQKF